MESTTNGKAATALLEGADGIVFDRDEHTVDISGAGVGTRTAGGHIVALSVPAPTEVATLRSAADAAPWSR
jgi:DNA-binding IclR family transcriptional regulator